ncbi:lytic polysaccharide monooxygenase auxiliary activity family 9 protein [Streptomyces bacillaris]|uniref:lytic polysaccharide monooxygenase auxiliary activity family 9 protein n=1 Tax=Streptomyces bacillaris TaxID=68179 RepID=UPI0037035270
MSKTNYGSVTAPQPRAVLHPVPYVPAGALVAGKFFPAVDGGLEDPVASSDYANSQPPVDGKIASAGHAEASALDAAAVHWTMNEVRSAASVTVTWAIDAPKATRRFNYFLTRPGWDPAKPLARDQFETKPIHTEASELDPYYMHQRDLLPASETKHTVNLPERSGYHVLLAVWEFADSPNAVYQVIDLAFS